jgi:hypothetical protein
MGRGVTKELVAVVVELDISVAAGGAPPLTSFNCDLSHKTLKKKMT